MNIPTEGYLDDQNWWSNPAHPHAFTYANLDEYYPADYIKSATMPQHVVDAYVKFVMEYYEKIMGIPLEYLVEFGCAGGWFLERFRKESINVYGFEGSSAGIQECMRKELLVDQQDLRLMTLDHLGLTWDIAICSEVLEHVEESFTGHVVRLLTNSADLVWFSSEPPNTNKAHLHHCCEKPQKYWDNLFAFFGYKCFMLPDHVHSETAERSRCIYYASHLEEKFKDL